ncbi:MAG: dsDNA nuclease domain-containing protein [Zavarzinella sp.]
MSEELTPIMAPDQVLNPNDPGDATRRRFRYQDVRATCYILALFDEDEAIIEIICEQQEDILVKRMNGRFKGVQIKTREDGAMPFKSGDEEIMKSLQRFIEEERDFPGQFEEFVLGCNCGFWQEKKNRSNLPHLLDLARGKTWEDAPKPVLDFIKKLCPAPNTPKPNKSKKSAASPCSAGATSPSSATQQQSMVQPKETHEVMLDRAFSVFQKVAVTTTPSLTEMTAPVISLLATLECVGKNQSYDDLNSIAEALISEVATASSMTHASFKKHYFEICIDPEKAKADSILLAKRFDRARAEEVIRRAFRAKTPLADGTTFAADKLPVGTRTQQAKMTAGGIVIDDIEEAVQQRQAAEYVLSSWINKFGVSKANAQYQDLRSAVLTEANEAKRQAAEAQPGAQYGAAMLMLVKGRVRQLHQDSGNALHGVRYDQLLGIAGIMTEECPLWWSQRFDLHVEAAS